MLTFSESILFIFIVMFLSAIVILSVGFAIQDRYTLAWHDFDNKFINLSDMDNNGIVTNNERYNFRHMWLSNKGLVKRENYDQVYKDGKMLTVKEFRLEFE